MPENFSVDVSLYFQVKAETQYEAYEKINAFLDSLKFPADFHSFDTDLNYIHKFPLDK